MTKLDESILRAIVKQSAHTWYFLHPKYVAFDCTVELSDAQIARLRAMFDEENALMSSEVPDGNR